MIGFRVGVRTKTMAFGFQFAAKIGEVIDLAVVSDPDGTVFVRRSRVRRLLVAHGHVAVGREVENREAATAETDVGSIGESALPETEVVGSAMRLDGGHAGQRLGVTELPAEFTRPLMPHINQAAFLKVRNSWIFALMWKNWTPERRSK